MPSRLLTADMGHAHVGTKNVDLEQIGTKRRLRKSVVPGHVGTKRRRDLRQVGTKRKRRKTVDPEHVGTERNTVESEILGPSGEEYAISTTDTAFKHMLSLSVDGDKSVMCSFLNCFVPEFKTDPVANILEEWPIGIPILKKKRHKQTFMDIHVATKSGLHYIVEMQAQRHEQFDERCLFYACSTYSKQLNAKELEGPNWYCLLRPTIAIQILGFDLNRAIGITGIHGRDGNELIDKLVARVKRKPLPTGEYI